MKEANIIKNSMSKQKNKAKSNQDKYFLTEKAIKMWKDD